MGSNPGARLRLSVIAGLTVLLAGCSIHDVENPFTVTTNANGKPVIWQCSLARMATPAEYACSDGKTYTAFQLRELRLNTDEANDTNKSYKRQWRMSTPVIPKEFVIGVMLASQAPLTTASAAPAKV